MKRIKLILTAVLPIIGCGIIYSQNNWEYSSEIDGIKTTSSRINIGSSLVLDDIDYFPQINLSGGQPGINLVGLNANICFWSPTSYPNSNSPKMSIYYQNDGGEGGILNGIQGLGIYNWEKGPILTFPIDEKKIIAGEPANNILNFELWGKLGIGKTNPAYQIDVNGDINFTGNLYKNGQLVTGSGGGISPWGSNGTSLYYNSGNVGIGTTTPNYKFTVAGDIYANGGWLRASGNAGVYFESYGGGFYMTDDSWIRTYGSKNFYHDAGIMRTDGILQVGPNGDRLVVTQDGKTGLGTTSPAEKLEVAGNIKATKFIGDGSGLTGITGTSQWTTSGSSIYYTSGNILINKTSQANTAYKLDVAGKVRADEVFVNTTGADFVFDPTYKLLSLSEVETFIGQNMHLPDLASAAEMQADGVSMGDMQTKLLQKVEELTLYSIAQEKKCKELQQKLDQQNNDFEKRLAEQEARVEQLLKVVENLKKK